MPIRRNGWKALLLLVIRKHGMVPAYLSAYRTCGMTWGLGMKYDIIAGLNFPHRLASGKTSAEVDAWCSVNNYVRLNHRDRKIGCNTAEAVVVPRAVFDRRPDLNGDIAR